MLGLVARGARGRRRTGAAADTLERGEGRARLAAVRPHRRVTVERAQIDRPGQKAFRRANAARMVGDHGMSRPVASRRFSRGHQVLDYSGYVSPPSGVAFWKRMNARGLPGSAIGSLAPPKKCRTPFSCK